MDGTIQELLKVLKKQGIKFCCHIKFLQFPQKGKSNRTAR